ncbi:class I SAM-dependent methyltransferase [Sphingomicrobium clamense]|uniref:Class I SAM-dependent methyltransferase n=1 Tax=Sphingomicrobium clamense TaxID=2851013 RepID=A0ABS6V2D3_9SPHN|nr:class I SAM-dependent methyltransferase [Sphingomicrobium sp. B8]MBW0143731.1 class I SAM-dependent methyltransferase [Sphingomicrobium sp. B8]
MTDGGRVAGSFRDRAGQVYRHEGRILRSVTKGAAAAAYEAARDAGLYGRLVKKGLLVGLKEVEAPAALACDDVAYWLEHPTLPFISHPYEWPFALWKKAAITQLRVHLEALKDGFTLSDATAYNIQFDGVTPRFIDHLSIQPYEEGEAWVGHYQFVSQFLGPLLLWDKVGIAPNHWMRGALEGIAPEDLAKMLPWKAKWSPVVLAHVVGLAALQKKRLATTPAEARAAKEKAKLPKARFVAILEGLKAYIEGLQPPGGESVWGEYADNTSYSSDEQQQKADFIGKLAADTKGLTFDIGCNSGDYSVAALEAGASRVIGFDFDHNALNLAVSRAEQEKLAFTPIWLDAANPSPDQGWAEREREGFARRVRGDAMVALAVVHHIAIGRNVPLDEVVGWLMDMAPDGIIEFPDKQDNMVKTLLAMREDIFDDYTEEDFRAAIEKRGRIVDELRLVDGHRLLVRYSR